MTDKIIYALVADFVDSEVVFYVGRTNDFKRRLREHMVNHSNEKHFEYATLKYEFMRRLQAEGLTWRMRELCRAGEDELADEYTQVLLYARENSMKYPQGIIAGLPLTNMKRGDFLDEMIDDPDVSTDPVSVRRWIDNRNKRARVVDLGGSIADVEAVKRARAILNQVQQDRADEILYRRKKELLTAGRRLKRLYKDLDEAAFTGNRPGYVAQLEAEIRQLEVKINELEKDVGKSKD